MPGQELAGRARRADVYDVLRNVRRRYVIYYLKSRGEPVPVDDLVDQIVAWESARSNGDESKRRRRSVRNSLIQTHLPKLDRHGFVDFDRRERIVRPTERVDAVDVYPASQTVEWSRYFALLGTVTLAIGGLELFAAPVPFDAMPWKSIALVGFVLLAVCFAYDRYRWQRRFERDGPDIVIDGAWTE